MVDLHFTRTPSEWLETDFLLESIDICWAEAVRGKLESKTKVSFFRFRFPYFRFKESRDSVSITTEVPSGRKKEEIPSYTPLIVADSVRSNLVLSHGSNHDKATKASVVPQCDII